MNKSSLVAAALAGLVLSSACASSATKGSGDSVKSDEVAKGECHGINSCKGKGECGGPGYSCSGNNSCKGQGWISLTQKECAEKGGAFKAD